MGRPGIPRSGKAPTSTHGSARRDSGNGRLDPVRWRRPGSGTLMRLTAVALLLATAAVVSWSPTTSCGMGSHEVRVGAAIRGHNEPETSSAGFEGTARPSAAAASGAAESSAAAPGAGEAGASRNGTAALGAGASTPGTAGEGVDRMGTGAASICGDATGAATGVGSTGSTPTGAAAESPPESRPAAAPPGPTSTLPTVPEGRMGVPVRPADPAALSLVRPGHRVDLLRPDGTPVASDALVLSVTDPGDLIDGGLLLALSPAEAKRAVATPGQGFAILVRPG